MEEIILIRHGESEANAGLTREPDCDLTVRGVGQAESVGRALAEYDLSSFELRMSPYRRTRCTADLISQALGRPFTVDARIREWGPSCAIDGHTFSTESREELAVRMRDFYDLIRGTRHLLVSHAAPIAVLMQIIAGKEPVLSDNFWEGVENCRLYHFRNGRLALDKTTALR